MYYFLDVYPPISSLNSCIHHNVHSTKLIEEQQLAAHNNQGWSVAVQSIVDLPAESAILDEIQALLVMSTRTGPVLGGGALLGCW